MHDFPSTAVTTEQRCNSSPAAIPIHLHPCNSACLNCAVSALCLPKGLSEEGNGRFDALIAQRIRVKKGSGLYHANDPLTHLYAVRFGSFKTCFANADGRGLVTRFLMSGDMLGLEAISTGRHICSAFALEDSEVCPIPYQRLESLAHDFPFLQQNLNRMLSGEIVREHEMLLTMCNLNAEERLASFLLNLSQKYVKRGYSAHGFVLRMSREDIASYLGLRLETICRSIARLRDLEIVRFEGRVVEILDMPALRALEHGYGKCTPS